MHFLRYAWPMNPEEPSATQVVEVVDSPTLMECVLELHRAHRKTLGFIPAGGFDDHAKKRQLLVAVRGEACVGYLMYRESRRLRRATIVHLCTDPSVRGQGVTRLLVDGLKARTKHLDSIRLRCRRDFDAHRIWPKLGFQIIGEAPGRSIDGHLLVTWSLMQQELPLLRLLAEAERASRFVVAVDANVFFDWDDESSTAEESQGLLAGWLDEHVDLCITAELATEIDRKDNATLRASAQARARNFRTLTGTPEAYSQALHTAIAVLGPANSKQQDESDRRQLAHAVACDADYFVTRDGTILKASRDLEERLATSVARPGDVVRRISASLDDSLYEPRRFEGSRLKTRGPKTGPTEETRLANAFLRSDNGERKAEFLSEVRRALSDPKCSQIVEIFDRNERSLLFAVRVLRSDGSLDYTRFRLGRDRLAPTVARQYLTTELASRSADVFMVSDRGATPDAVAALEDAGFLSTGETWIKAGRLAVEPSESAIAWIEDQPELRPLAAHARALVAGGRMVEAERLFWPTKFEDLEIPSFVVPIKPTWAMQLFDTKLAERDLFGLPAELGFAFENAYFRAPRPHVVRAPGRVLWYVSGAVGAVRACSYIDQVIVGPANDLFRRFRRLGIYEWANICKLTDGNPTASIMVVQFSGTELFEHPVNFKTTQELLTAHGRSPNQFASPVAIEPPLFGAIYQAGRNLVQEDQR